jgi:hypothetical protein
MINSLRRRPYHTPKVLRSRTPKSKTPKSKRLRRATIKPLISNFCFLPQEVRDRANLKFIKTLYDPLARQKSILLVVDRFGYLQPNIYSLRRKCFVYGDNGKVKGLIAEAVRLSVRSSKNKDDSYFGSENLVNSDKSSRRFVYYPRPEDLELFQAASRNVRDGGPAKEYFAGVGSVELFEVVHNKWCIEYIQSHFIQGNPSELTREIATKYGGWRQRVLDVVFKEALKKQKVPTIQFNVPVKVMSGVISKGYENRMNIFEAVAKANGFEIKRNLESFSSNYDILYSVAKKKKE